MSSTNPISSMKKTHSPYSTTKPHSKAEIGHNHEVKHEKQGHQKQHGHGKHQSLGKHEEDLFGTGTLPEEYEQDHKSENKESKFKHLNSCHQFPHIKHPDNDNFNLEKMLQNNVEWAKQMSVLSPHLFQKLSEGQHPEYLWIGCSDSRIPAEEVVGFKPGDLFVHRNIANQAPLSDGNAMAVLQFAVQSLKVKDIVVCGHYGCGGIKAAMKKEDYGALETWLSYIRNLKMRFRKELISENPVQNEHLLVQLNVRENVFNIARSATVQKAWREGRKLRIHGLVYTLQTGLLKNLQITLNSIEDIPEESRFY